MMCWFVKLNHAWVHIRCHRLSVLVCVMSMFVCVCVCVCVYECTDALAAPSPCEREEAPTLHHANIVAQLFPLELQ